MMRSVALALCGLASSAAAQDCAALMQSFRVAAPPPSLSAMVGEAPEGFGCSAAEMAMFQANHAAIAVAEPPADPADLYGTWLGDDVILAVAGITVAGQEVLRLGPGEDGGLAVTQYWYKAVTPNSPALPYDPEAGYLGLVAEGTLPPSGPPGRFEGELLGEAEIAYGTLRLEYERSHDLWVRARLNRFERPVEMALAGDTLVIRSDQVTPVKRSLAEQVDTFTRVAPGAPDLALLIVSFLEISQTAHFECFVHQLSDGRGPLLEALAPHGPEALRQALTAMVANEVQMAALRAQEPPPLDEMRALLEARIALMQAPTLRHLIDRIGAGADLGCAPLP